jgi:hypothetical protein
MISNIEFCFVKKRYRHHIHSNKRRKIENVSRILNLFKQIKNIKAKMKEHELSKVVSLNPRKMGTKAIEFPTIKIISLKQLITRPNNLITVIR